MKTQFGASNNNNTHYKICTDQATAHNQFTTTMIISAPKMYRERERERDAYTYALNVIE